MRLTGFDYGHPQQFVPVLGCAGSNRLQRHLEMQFNSCGTLLAQRQYSNDQLRVAFDLLVTSHNCSGLWMGVLG